jgi:hypothetical protein
MEITEEAITCVNDGPSIIALIRAHHAEWKKR